MTAKKVASARKAPPAASMAIGTPFEGGFYSGVIRILGAPCALILAPKALGQYVKDIAWARSTKLLAGALSYCDGLANTNAMAEAGSALGKWARGLTIGGFSDWCIPAQDQLEMLYRAYKSTATRNWCYARSGINLNAADPTPPYTPDSPLQTTLELFREDGAEAFDLCGYWSSTQHASGADYVWAQLFLSGHQDDCRKNDKLRARAIRISPLQ